MFQRLAAHAPVGLFLSDASGEVIYVNTRWCGMAGISAEDAMGDGWIEALHPGDRERVVAGWRRAVETGGDIHEQFRFLKPDGSVTWMDVSVSLMDDPQTGGAIFIGSCTDVTERRNWEARVRLYEGTFAMMPDFACVFGKDHRLVYANRSMLELWGLSWQSAVGKTWLELGYEPWHAEMHTREMETVMRTGEPWKGEIPFTGTQGKRICEYIFAPIFAGDGGIEAVSGITRDVTERKQAEDRANFLNRLAGKLAALYTEAEIVRVAVEAVGMYLGCHRCYFMECLMEEGLVRVGEDWVRDGGASLQGEHLLDEFGGEEWRVLCEGGDFVVADVEGRPMPDGMQAGYRRMGVRSLAVQPFKRQGEWTVALGAADRLPRRWTREEMELLENVIARVWPLVEHARAEAAMRKSQERLSLVANNLPAVVCLIGKKHAFRYGNERCREWFDYPKGKIVGAHLRDAIGEEAYLRGLPFFEKVLGGQPVKFEMEVFHKTLGKREMELACTPDRTAAGAVRGFFVLGTDITERKEEELAMKRRNEGRRLLGEVGRVIFTSDTPEMMLRRMWETVGGYLQADVCVVATPGETGEEARVDFFHGLEGEAAHELAGIYFGPMAVQGANRAHRMAKAYRVARALLERENVRGYAGRLLLAGQEVLGVLVFASRQRGVFSSGEREFMDALSQYVTAAHVRLRLVESLRESDRRKDQFLATLAHELRNPLAPILTGLEVLKRPGGDPEMVEHVSGIIGRQTAQMIHLINDLLDLSRVNTGKIVLKKSRASYVEILRSAIEASQPLIEERGHALETSLPGEGVMVEVDPSRVAQVVSNLLSNAAKYTPEGGEIRLEAGADGDNAWVKVCDNGQGIEPREQKAIFELFAQASNGSMDGLGIGLTLVKSLAELHGGSVSVASKGKGAGSEFHVELPGCVVAVPEEKAVAEEAAAVPAFPRKRVLVVDDGKSAADMLALFFRMEGMEVAVAYDGLEGLEKARTFLPDLVMMDMGMPVMDGLEAARRMRGEGIGSALVALSGWGREEDKRRTAEAGFDLHLVKPVRPDDLRAIMERYFRAGKEG